MAKNPPTNREKQPESQLFSSSPMYLQNLLLQNCTKSSPKNYDIQIQTSSDESNYLITPIPNRQQIQNKKDFSLNNKSKYQPNNNNQISSRNRENQRKNYHKKEQMKKGSYPLLDESRQSTRFQKPSCQGQYQNAHDYNTTNNRQNDHYQEFRTLNPNIQQNPNQHQILKNSNKSSKQIQIQQIFLDILQQIQLIDYKQVNKSKQKLKQDFELIIHGNIQFSDNYYPYEKSQVGKLLIKNGVFHQMWSKIALKHIKFSKMEYFRAFYYQKYIGLIEKEATAFQKAFNPIPSSSDDDNFEQASQTYRHYSELMKTHTRETKDNCIILFEKIRNQMQNQSQNERITSEFINSVKNRVQNYKFRTKQLELIDKAKPILDQNELNDESTSQVSSNESFIVLNNQMKSVDHHNAEHIHAKCSLDVLFDQCISNQKRLMCEMACNFLNISKLYTLSQIEIIQVKQMLFNQKQQMAIVKAYTADYCPISCMMKIYPQMKTLISVYRFGGLLQLVRLQRTYGVFDGMIVYSQYLKMQRFLNNIKENTQLMDLKEQQLICSNQNQ